jgi:hypothetical protein
MTMYVAQLWQYQENDVAKMLFDLKDEDVSFEELIKIDYFFHHTDPSYDGGLSFLDRIAAKIGRFHPAWNIENIKQHIRDAENPQLEYILVVSSMFSRPGMIAYYGV